MTLQRELAPAKINLALHVRRRRDDGRHDIETIFAFCTDGDVLTAEGFEHLQVMVTGPFAKDVDPNSNLVDRAALELRMRRGHDFLDGGVWLTLEKNLPVAAGLGGGSADAAAALRLLTARWGMDPAHASGIARELGSDVPACLLSMTALGRGAGEELELVDAGVAGTPVLLVNPGVPLATGEVFRHWDGIDRGPLGDWRDGRNDLEAPAVGLVPEIAEVLEWLRGRDGAWFTRMSGSGATCFALFTDEQARDAAADAVPGGWWRLASILR